MSAPRSPAAAALFSREELAAWSRLCRQEVLAELRQRDSWYYAFDRRVAVASPAGLAYELVRRSQNPPGRSYATKAATSHTLTHLSLPASVSSVAHGCMALPSSRHYRAMLAHILGDSLVDGGQLQVAERPTPLDPFHFVGVSFMAVKPPLLSPRSLVLFEHSGSVEDAAGELVVFKVVRSMPVDADTLRARIAPRSAALDFGELYVTLLLRGTDGGRRTDMKVQGMLRLDASMPGWATPKLSAVLLEGLERLGTAGASRVLQAKLGDTKRPGRRKEPAPPASSCPVCLRRRPRLGASARECAGCGRQACRACTQRMHVLGADGSSVLRQRFCLQCVREAQAAGGRADTPSTFSGAIASGNSSGSGGASGSGSSRGVAEALVWKRRPRSASTGEYSK